MTGATWSLRRRLGIVYHLTISGMLAIAGVSVAFVAVLSMTGPLAAGVTQTAADAGVLAAQASPAEATSALEQRITARLRRDGVTLLAIPPGVVPAAAPLDRPLLGELGVGALFGLLPHVVRVRDGALIVVPDPAVSERLVRAFLLAVVAIVIAAIVAGRLVAATLVRQSLAPLYTVTAELARFGAGDFSPRLLAPGEAREFRDLAEAYNQAGRQVADAFLERSRVEERFREFVADAGHELRTPLTVIGGYVDVLRRDALDPTGRSSALSAMALELRRMRTLVERLMTLARLDHELPAHPERFDAVSIVDQAVHALSVVAPVAIRRDGAASALVVGEPGDLYEAVANLIENAIKYGNDSPIAVEVHAGGGEVAVRVRDGGPGIPEQHRVKIFERFYRACDANVPGSGLGLVIAAGAARRLGGTLTLEDAHPGATTFALSLPAASHAAPAQELQSETGKTAVTLGA